MGEVVNIELSKVAENLSRLHNSNGCIIVTYTDNGSDIPSFNLGFFNLRPNEMQGCGCAAIHIAFLEANKDA